MSIAYARHFSTRQTPQSEPIPGKPMVQNSAGGYSFAVEDWQRLNRFLILGAEGASYYASERKLTIENAQCVLRCLDADPARVVRTIVEISDAGRAPKNDPAIFALAMAAGHTNPEARKAALEALPQVCRIGTHLFQFTEAVKSFRGFGKGLRKAIGAWYTDKTPDQLALQVAKYQSRNGWSHRDLLRLAHPRTDDPARDAVLRWAVAGPQGLGERSVTRGRPNEPGASAVASYGDLGPFLPRLIRALEEAKATDEVGVVRLIREDRLPRECIPTQHLNSPAVWEALLEHMPLTAMVRNLGKMTAVGLLKPMSAAAKAVADRLGDQDYIRKSRLHPLAILVAAKIYAQGHGEKGKLSWMPVSTINDSLDSAFYLAFGNVEPAGKRTLIALDVSGSMDGGSIAGSPLTPREGSAALAMVTARTEPQYQVVGFTCRGNSWSSSNNTLTRIDMSKFSRLSDVIEHVRRLPMGGTDCALPMLGAIEQKWEVDTFMILTDSESWAGKIHASQALTQYRQKTSIPARAVCVGMVANEFSVLDPADPGSLNIVGFDTATPQVISAFSRGDI